MHLSAISLPRKQLSIENSACSGFLLIFLLDSGQFAVVVPPAFVLGLCWVFPVFVLSCPVLSCPVRVSEEEEEKEEGKVRGRPLPGAGWLSAQSARLACVRRRLTSCHLHSTDMPPEFCEELETVGSARVSMTAAVRELEDGEEDEDEEAATAPAEGRRSQVDVNN